MNVTGPVSPSAPHIDLTLRKIAYFSMEIALSKALPTYSGGLGMLAGDTLRSAADMGAPLVAVSLAHRKGYFQQHLDSVGQQTESDVVWHPEITLPAAGESIVLTMQGRDILIRAWRFDVVGVTGHIIPVYLLDTDVEGNNAFDRSLTDKLYGGDTYYRLCQETVLGLGGIQLLHALGMKPEVCHMNEGHAALLSVGLLEERLDFLFESSAKPLTAATEADFDAVQADLRVHHAHPCTRRVTTSSASTRCISRARPGPRRPHPAARAVCINGVLQHDVPRAALFALCQRRCHAALARSRRKMFPEYQVHSITNGVHAATWLSEAVSGPASTRKFRSGVTITSTSAPSTASIRRRYLGNALAIGQARLFATVAKRNGIAAGPRTC